MTIDDLAKRFVGIDIQKRPTNGQNAWPGAWRGVLMPSKNRHDRVHEIRAEYAITVYGERHDEVVAKLIAEVERLDGARRQWVTL